MSPVWFTAASLLVTMTPNHIKILFGQYVSKNISPAEKDELMQLLTGLSDEALEQLLHETYENFEPEKPPFSPAASAELWQAIRAHTTTEAVPVVTLNNRKRHFRWWQVAALFVLSIGALWLWHNNTKQHPAVTAKQFIVPGGNKALLTLADGSTIILDSAANGLIATQNNTSINNSAGGMLKYSLQKKDSLTINPTDAKAMAGRHSTLTNTISTPRGGQYQLLLPDGSEVYLDAASSLRFPVEFTGKERRVQLTGQAWFHVARNKAMPFHVEVLSSNRPMDVEVLGTKFNIMAYEDEQQVQTTLLEGAVKAAKRETANGEENSIILKPGQQAVLSSHSPLIINHSPAIEQVMAWKNGNFFFNGSDIQTVMRQLARWYNINVKYTSAIKGQNFEGKLPRNTSLEKVLQVLAATGAVQFKIENRTIIVIPQKQEN